MLEAMEQQTISVAKAGMVCKLRTKCTVVAATNPKGGKMDRSVALHTQTGLATPLISRFDIVLLLSDADDPERDQRLSTHILSNTPRGAAAASSSGVSSGGVGSAGGAMIREEAWPLEKLRAYLEYVKATFKPTLSESAQRVLTGYYSMQRGATDRDAARSTIRMLEALVRLAQAHARLMFRGECTVMDAVFAIILMEGSHNSSQLLENNFSVLRAEFLDNPDGEYSLLEHHVLTGIGFAGDEFSAADDTAGNGAGAGGGASSGHGGRGSGPGPGGCGADGNLGGGAIPVAKRPRTADGAMTPFANHNVAVPPPRAPGAAAPSHFEGFY